MLLRGPTFQEGEGEARRKERGKGRECGGAETELKGICRVQLKPSQSQISGYVTVYKA